MAIEFTAAAGTERVCGIAELHPRVSRVPQGGAHRRVRAGAARVPAAAHAQAARRGRALGRRAARARRLQRQPVRRGLVVLAAPPPPQTAGGALTRRAPPASPAPSPAPRTRTSGDVRGPVRWGPRDARTFLPSGLAREHAPRRALFSLNFVS